MARLMLAKEWDALKRIAVDVAGRGRGGMVLRALEGKVFVDEQLERSSLHFDETRFEIHKLVYGRPRCPYIMAHEFGHAYHCFYWPVLSALMTVPNPRAEAVAYLFELELKAVADRRYTSSPPAGLPHFCYLGTSTWKARAVDLRAFKCQDPEPFDLLEKALHNPPTDFHALAGRIVDGR